MSLQVWLPLNGDFNNQGLNGQAKVTNYNVEINNSGKIGKCGSFNGTNAYLQFSGLNMNSWANFTIAFWCYTTVSLAGIFLIRQSQQHQFNISATGISFRDTKHSSSLVSLQFDQPELEKWTHCAIVYKNGSFYVYHNGIKIFEQIYANSATLNTGLNEIRIGRSQSTSGNTYYNGKINDFRIYDHALSAKEVEEISKGLILHYKLDKNLSVLNNCYSYPTFNTSSSSGGWSHWGSSGHKGSSGQNTNKDFIFNKNNTYSHWVANGSDATKSYIIYQSPAFDGGFRSLQAIIKEENGLPITESICFPDWNGRNGGTPANKWTSIISLGNGFYLCKCEGISQDGSNNLIGIYVRPGYKIYISEAYLENNKEICSDIFNQNNLTTIYDSSGYANDGTAIGGLTAAASSPRYDVATVFNGTNSVIKVNSNVWMIQRTQQLTINLWTKATTWPTNGGRLISCTESGGFNFEAGNSGYWRFPVHVYTSADSSSTAYKYDSKEIKIADLLPNAWNMITCVYEADKGTKTYINGELHHTYSNVSYGIHFNTNARLFLGCEANTASPYAPYFNGQISDFRIYATALTDGTNNTVNQIKELYTTSASIDSSGNIHARELVEL